ncbi:MAG: restriction endonuclease subunit S [Gammaproteobacteria bacterium]|nr:restriction endonuclease subunit S [Gammaproteobacteria bacterium]MBU1416133.1 restriction endonuclease subunit S [Gammaproteobacteria bacterium]
MANSWIRSTVGDVSERVTKGTTPTTVGGHFAEGGINFIKVESIRDDGRFDKSKLAFIDDETNRLLARSVLREHDVLFTIAGTIGRVARVTNDMLPANTNQAVAIVRPSLDLVDPRFLYYTLRDEERVRQAHTRVVQSVQANFSLTELSAIEVLLPRMDEQRAVAAVLGDLDDKIEHNRRTAQALERLARAIFRAWFVDFEPVKAKAGGATSFPSMPQAVFEALPTRFVDSEIGPVPEGWVAKPLAGIATFLNGLALQKYPPRGDDNDLPVIKIAELRKGSTAGADWANGDVTEQYVIQDRDLLFSWSGTLEAEFWFGGKGALNQHLFKVTSSHFPSWFCLLWIRQHLPTFRQIASSKATTMGHIKREHLHEAKVVVPPAAVLQEAEAIIGPLFDLHAALQIESRKLSGMRDYLLPKLLSGEVRVTVQQEG